MVRYLIGIFSEIETFLEVYNVVTLQFHRIFYHARLAEYFSCLTSDGKLLEELHLLRKPFILNVILN